MEIIHETVKKFHFKQNTECRNKMLIENVIYLQDGFGEYFRIFFVC